MTQDSQRRAQKVVQVFRKNLSDDVQNQIGDDGFNRLTMLIDEAIQDELKESALLIEEVLKKIREKIEHPEIGM